MAEFISIQKKAIAEKWKGTNFSTIFEFLDWQVWSKIDNSASGENFSIDNTPVEEGMETGGDGILYVKVGVTMTPVTIGDYIVKENDGSLSIADATAFELEYIQA